MLMNVRCIVSSIALTALVFCGASLLAKSTANKRAAAKNKPQAECRLLEDDFDLALLQNEFEGIKNTIIARSKILNFGRVFH